MRQMTDRVANRQRFLKFLAGSPLLAMGSIGSSIPELLGEAIQDSGLIDNPADAINVFDFEAVARDVLPLAHWGYLATGVDDDRTLKANREGFTKFAIRPRRLVDVSRPDLSTELFGMTLKSPIILCPVGSQKAFHPEGEVAVVRAAKARDHLQILSTVTTSSVEEVAEARGGPVWYQLYPQGSLEISRALIRRAEAAGSPAIVLTIDLLAGRNTETSERFARRDDRACANCHTRGNRNARKPMLAGLDPAVLETRGLNSALTWDFVRRLRDTVRGRLVLKGIETSEDAWLAVQNGVDGIIVSNHGGRATESGRGTIEALPEVIGAVEGRIPVLIDGGFRRGTDIFKALAIGARAICIGRPYIWGLSAFGQAGVERVLEILEQEFELVMQQSGATSPANIGRSYVTRR